MAYFPDLSPYAYGSGKHSGVVHVGWLDGTHPYTKGRVAYSFIESMKKMAETPTELYRGFHLCDLCERDKPRSNGEIRVSRAGLTYAAPVLIVHYIEKHGYAPPREFLDALEMKPNHSPDPTLASGTSPAGQEPRHR
jgi:hypothetical protein